MPLRDGLLDPIDGENPSGPDLRYDPVVDQIKEARREDDDTLPAAIEPARQEGRPSTGGQAGR